MTTVRIIAACAVCAMVASAATATAGQLVTSRQIRDRTIRITDLNPQTVNQLRGKPGPAGPAGPQGPAGAAARGGGITRVYKRSLYNAPAVWCDPGDVAFGGSISQISLRYSDGPVSRDGTDTPHGWVGDADTSGPYPAMTTVVCATITG